MDKKFLKYDWFKLIVLIILIALLIILLFQKYPSQMISEPAAEHSTVEEPGDVESKEGNNLPDLPAGAESLMVDEAGTGLVDSDGNLRYALSADGESWIPVIPDAIKSNLPDGYQVMQDESGVWHITSPDGDTLYTFNHKTMEWEMIEKDTGAESEDAGSEPAASVDCTGANPRRISGIDLKVKVVNVTLPLRSSPDAESANFIASLPQGTILEVVNEPVCTPFLGGANLWWFVRMVDGVEGYTAEGSAVSDTYYLEEIK